MTDLFIQSVAGFISALLGALGMGGGGVLLIYLTALAQVSQTKAQGINLLFFIPVAITALILHCKNKLVNYKMAIIGVLTGVAGVFAGFAVARQLGDQILSKVFAVFLLILGAKELFGGIDFSFLKRKTDKDKKNP